MCPRKSVQPALGAETAGPPEPNERHFRSHRTQRGLRPAKSERRCRCTRGSTARPPRRSGPSRALSCAARSSQHLPRGRRCSCAAVGTSPLPPRAAGRARQKSRNRDRDLAPGRWMLIRPRRGAGGVFLRPHPPHPPRQARATANFVWISFSFRGTCVTDERTRTTPEVDRGRTSASSSLPQKAPVSGLLPTRSSETPASVVGSSASCTPKRVPRMAPQRLESRATRVASTSRTSTTGSSSRTAPTT